MRKTKYAVALTEAERARLRTMVGSGTAPARTLTRARVLLKADQGEGGPGWSDAAIAGALDVHPATVARVRRQAVEDGLDTALARQRHYPAVNWTRSFSQYDVVGWFAREVAPDWSELRAWALALLQQEGQEVGPDAVDARLKRFVHLPGAKASDLLFLDERRHPRADRLRIVVRMSAIYPQRAAVGRELLGILDPQTVAGQGRLRTEQRVVHEVLVVDRVELVVVDEARQVGDLDGQ